MLHVVDIAAQHADFVAAIILCRLSQIAFGDFLNAHHQTVQRIDDHFTHHQISDERQYQRQQECAAHQAITERGISLRFIVDFIGSFGAIGDCGQQRCVVSLIQFTHCFGFLRNHFLKMRLLRRIHHRQHALRHVGVVGFFQRFIERQIGGIFTGPVDVGIKSRLRLFQAGGGIAEILIKDVLIANAGCRCGLNQ